MGAELDLEGIQQYRQGNGLNKQQKRDTQKSQWKLKMAKEVAFKFT